MDSTRIWHAETLAKAACAALKKNGFDARYAATGADALDMLEGFVSEGNTVGLGGSMTLREIGAAERLSARGARLLDHAARGIAPEQKLAVMRAQLTCDVFISGSNAITLDGEIFNIDGNGNRIAALTFGPKKTVVVAGYNKIVRNLAEAESRAETMAAPMNNKRLDTANPCAKSGLCADCHAETRICRVYSVLKRRPSWSDFTVIIIGEEHGF